MARTPPEIDAIAAFITEQQRHNPRHILTEASVHGVIKPEEFAEAVLTAIMLTDTSGYWASVADSYGKPKSAGAAIKHRAESWLKTLVKQVAERHGMDKSITSDEIFSLHGMQMRGHLHGRDKYRWYWSNCISQLASGYVETWDKSHRLRVHPDMIEAGTVDPTLLRFLSPTLKLFGISPSQFESAMSRVASLEPSYL